VPNDLAETASDRGSRRDRGAYAQRSDVAIRVGLGCCRGALISRTIEETPNNGESLMSESETFQVTAPGVVKLAGRPCSA
jgi:hypothetical protein